MPLKLYSRAHSNTSIASTWCVRYSLWSSHEYLLWAFLRQLPCKPSKPPDRCPLLSPIEWWHQALLGLPEAMLEERQTLFAQVGPHFTPFPGHLTLLPLVVLCRSQGCGQYWKISYSMNSVFRSKEFKRR